MNNITKGGSIVLNADDKFFKFHQKIAFKKKLKVYSFSLNKKNVTVRLNSIKKYKSKFKLRVFIRLPDFCASLIPFSESSTSTHPVNLF